MVHKIIHSIRLRPGFWLLCLVLLFIVLVNLKPNLNLLGWDNYSSFLDHNINFFRTIFATWREYRGFGVPSDSESTDIIRQFFFLVVGSFVKSELLDQLFVLIMLVVGTISMYFFSSSMWIRYSNNNHNHNKSDLVGFLASLFYVFNLNTLATFYFPMIMFIIRFASLPLLLYFLLRIFSPHSKRFDYIGYAVSVLVTSGAYMTATVFVTTFLVIGIFIIFTSTSIRKTLITLLLFVLINSFWIITFLNYTIQKSNIVYKAPTFIEANEIQLNKPALFYAPEKQLILYPNFFETPITDTTGTKVAGYHQISSRLNNPLVRTYIFIFPFGYLLGSVLLTYKGLRRKSLLWLPITISLFLFLSMKAFSPLGFLFVWFEKNIPFFSQLFRFGDTKFHAFIAFSGSIAASFFIVEFFSLFKKRFLVYLLGIFILLGGILTYKEYFNGNIVGFFVRNKIPDAYYQVAKEINLTPGEGRVLHLPFDQNGYWRSYRWGYLGSSFFHFLINKPLFEKTFEPASSENALMNKAVFDLISNMQLLRSQGTQDTRVNTFYRLLQQTGTQFILFDGTVSAEQPVRGINLWGRFNTVDSLEMITELESKGYIKSVATHSFDENELLDYYPYVFPISNEIRNQVNTGSVHSIILYEVQNVRDKFSISSKYEFRNELETQIFTDNHDIVQFDGEESTLLPFQRKDVVFKPVNDFMQVEYVDVDLKKDKIYSLLLPEESRYTEGNTLLTVHAKKQKDAITFQIFQKITPDVIFSGSRFENRVLIGEYKVQLPKGADLEHDSTSTNDYLANWHVLGDKPLSQYRLQIGKSTLAIPILNEGEDTYLGAMFESIGQVDVHFLQLKERSQIAQNSTSLTDTPNCFGDKLNGYEYGIEARENELSIQSRNGSTCLVTKLLGLDTERTPYAELSFSYRANQSNLDSIDDVITSKKHALNEIYSLEKPSTFTICIKDGAVAECFNSHQVAFLQSEGNIIVPTDRGMSAFDPIVFMAIKNIGLQEQNIHLKNLILKTYEVINTETITISQFEKNTITFRSPENSKLTLAFETPIGESSFHLGKLDGFYVSNGVCQNKNSFRTFRKLEDNGLISYLVQCDTSISVPVKHDGNSLTIWGVDYNLMSGKFPRFVLSNGYFTYVSEYTSLNQGYPNIREFHTLQNPDTFFDPIQSSKNVLNMASYTRSDIRIPPYPEYGDHSEKNFIIAQDSENEGIIKYTNMNIFSVPGIWYNLKFVPDSVKTVSSTDTGNITAYEQILPSLWKVKLENIQNTELLIFNEGFDAQWGVYSSGIDLFFGREIEQEHYKCNGFANCFRINPAEQSEYFIFYWPERLNFLGWLVTFGTLLAVILWRLPKNSFKSSR